MINTFSGIVYLIKHLATGWRVQGSNSGGGVITAPVHTSPGGHSAPYTMGTGSYPGVNWLGCGLDHPPLTRAKVKERAELYLYSSSGPSWPVLRQTLLLNAFQAKIIRGIFWYFANSSHQYHSTKFICTEKLLYDKQ